MSVPTQPKTAPVVKPAVGKPTQALLIETVDVDVHCIGSRWTAADVGLLARIIAIIAMGQAAHVARIIAELLPHRPAINHEDLKANAKRKLSILGKTESQQDVSRYHRDGLIFESISWAAARQSAKQTALLKDPHLSSTAQGLDGLMLELNQASTAIVRATIFEDKCSEHPRQKFHDEILPAFVDHHTNKRAAELVAAAAALIEKAGLNGTEATKAAARVLDKATRVYRGSLVITSADDSVSRRKALFADYEQLANINADQRIAATFVTPTALRPWFDALANKAVAYIDTLKAGTS